MSRALMINQEYFYENSTVDKNTDYEIIRPILWDCQELYIKDIIGSPLYDVITAEIISNGGTLTTARLLTLVNDYIAPCLLKYTLKEASIFLLFKIRNRSISTDRSDFSDPIDRSELKLLEDRYRETAEAYAEKIERYICANQSTYPEYTTYTSSDEVRAQRQRPTSSLYLGGMQKGGNGYGYEYYEKNR